MMSVKKPSRVLTRTFVFSLADKCGGHGKIVDRSNDSPGVSLSLPPSTLTCTHTEQHDFTTRFCDKDHISLPLSCIVVRLISENIPGTAEVIFLAGDIRQFNNPALLTKPAAQDPEEA